MHLKRVLAQLGIILLPEFLPRKNNNIEKVCFSIRDKQKYHGRKNVNLHYYAHKIIVRNNPSLIMNTPVWPFTKLYFFLLFYECVMLGLYGPSCKTLGKRKRLRLKPTFKDDKTVWLNLRF